MIKKILLWIAGIFVGLIVLFVISDFFTPPTKPGPLALQMEAQMKPYELTTDVYGFRNTFGGPAVCSRTNVGGEKLIIWDYHYKDGDVAVFVNDETSLIDRVLATGL